MMGCPCELSKEAWNAVEVISLFVLVAICFCVWTICNRRK